MIRPLLVAATLLVSALPAAAQWVAVGRWGTPEAFRYVAPGSWMVLAGAAAGTVEISAEGDNHVGRLVLRCDPRAPAGEAVFSQYYGDALALEAETPVELRIDGQGFARAFRYDPAARLWRAPGPLDAAFLDAFAQGRRMELVTGAGTLVTRYRLSGSGAARAALQRSCGL